MRDAALAAGLTVVEGDEREFRTEFTPRECGSYDSQLLRELPRERRFVLGRAW